MERVPYCLPSKLKDFENLYGGPLHQLFGLFRNFSQIYLEDDLTYSDSKLHLKVKGHTSGCDLWCLQHEACHGLVSVSKYQIICAEKLNRKWTFFESS